MADDPILRAYIERLEALRSERDAALTPADLRAIALEMGMTEADLEGAAAAARGHRKRGEGFMEHGLWDDAIAELQPGAALAPGDVPTLHALALAHQGRWQGQPVSPADDPDRAERLARRCLELDPDHQPSYALLDAIRRQRKRQESSNIKVFLGAALVLVGLAGAVGYGFVAWRSDRPAAPSPPPTALPVLPAPSSGAAESAAPPQVAAPGESDIPILLTGPVADRLAMVARRSRLVNYRDSSYYTLHASLKNIGRTELRKVQVTLTLRDAHGNVVKADAFAALDTYQAPLRPGDQQVVEKLLRAVPNVRDARLEARLVDEEPAPPRYAAARLLALRWAAQRPEHVALEVRERSAGVSRNRFSEGVHWEAVLELHNAGQGALTRLKYQVDYLDRAGRLLKTSETLVAYASAPSLLPGEIRLRREVEQLPDGYDRYTITILEAE